MALMLSQSFKNLPANSTEMSALKELLDSDLEHRSFIFRRQEKVQARYTYAKKATEVYADCLATTSAAKDAFAASILSTKALEETLKNTLNLYNNHNDILAPTSSTKGMLATFAEIVALTEALLTHLEKTAPQVEAQLHLVADEHAAHESAHIAASESMDSCTDSLNAVDRSIAKKKGALFGIRHIPTEMLARIFIEAVGARQREIITSLSSFHDAGSSNSDLNRLSTTLNLVPFRLSAICKRWRTICQSTPQLWRYAQVPMTITYNHHNRPKIIGKTQLERCVLLARNQPLDLTVFPCYDVTHRGATYPNLALLAGSRILRVNIVWHSNRAIPQGIPSPTELCIVASANSPTPYPQILPTELLANTKKLRCTELTPQINSAVGIETMHISLSKPAALPPLQSLLQNCPELKELHLEIGIYPTTIHNTPSFTHQQLHTFFLTGIALPWVTNALIAGCRFPRLSCFVFTDINGLDPAWDSANLHLISDQLSHITHIEVQVASEPNVVARFRLLFDASTALRTLTLAGSAVGLMLRSMTLSPPKKVEELRLYNSDANGTTLRDYLAALERSSGGTSGIKVVWNDCPNFSGEYGGAFGELHL